MSSAGRNPLDRSSPPVPGDRLDFSFPHFERSSRDDRPVIYAAPIRRTPLVNLGLISQGGAQNDPQGLAGLATLTAALLDEGTARFSALEIAGQAERLGGYVASGADWDVAHVSMGCLSRHLERGLKLVAEVASAPAFPTNEIERLRDQRAAELQRRLAQPPSLVSVVFSRAIYGSQPYGHSLLGTQKTVAGITREAIVDFYNKQYVPASSAVIAVGDFEPESLVPLVRTALDGWKGSGRNSPVVITPPALETTRIEIVDLPLAAQTELRVGHAGLPRVHPDFVPVQIMNALLGGKFTSRLNLNLRERHGITYGAHSKFVQRLGPGPFVVSAAVETESIGQAVDEVREELGRLRTELVHPDELEETKSYLLGVFPYTLQTIEDVASHLEELAIFGLPDDYFETFAEEVQAVDSESVRRVAQDHLDPDRLVVAAAGPAVSLEKQLQHLGPVKIQTPTELDPT